MTTAVRLESEKGVRELLDQPRAVAAAAVAPLLRDARPNIAHLIIGCIPKERTRQEADLDIPIGSQEAQGRPGELVHLFDTPLRGNTIEPGLGGKGQVFQVALTLRQANSGGGM
jgi:hypothetical protein